MRSHVHFASELRALHVWRLLCGHRSSVQTYFHRRAHLLWTPGLLESVCRVTVLVGVVGLRHARSVRRETQSPRVAFLAFLLGSLWSFGHSDCGWRDELSRAEALGGRERGTRDLVVTVLRPGSYPVRRLRPRGWSRSRRWLRSAQTGLPEAGQT